MFAVLLACVFFYGAGQSDFPRLQRTYLGQKPPGKNPLIFAPGIVSTGLEESTIAFTPDGTECYWTIHVNGFETIAVSKLSNGVWTKPDVASFCGKFLDGFPAIHPDGSRFFFHSYRPLTTSDSPAKNVNIWYMDRKNGTWGVPKPIGPPINGSGNVTCPSVTCTGTLYFSRVMEDGSEQVMCSVYKDGMYLDPVPLPDTVNSDKYNFHACIAPDESFLIIPRHGRSDCLGGEWNYYVSFRRSDGGWSELKNLGSLINNSRAAVAPSLSSDGKYFFFQADFPASYSQKIEKRKTLLEWKEYLVTHPVNYGKDIYWVDINVIRELRPEE